VLTSTAGGLRSGRERKAFAGVDELLDKGLTFGAREGLALGSCEDLPFEVRSSKSQLTVFVNARYVAPALTTVRNLRRVNFVPIIKLATISLYRVPFQQFGLLDPTR
jgi:hypothetical protein